MYVCTAVLHVNSFSIISCWAFTGIHTLENVGPLPSILRRQESV